MFRKIFLKLLLFVSPIVCISQNQKTLFDVVIMGVDMSQAKIVTRNNYDVNAIIKNDIPRLNQELTRICIQYREEFKGDQLIVDTNEVARKNALIIPESILADKRFLFSNGDSLARSIASKYDLNGYERGVGFLIVMERIDEIENRESFYLVMLDLKSKKIMHCDKVEAGISAVKNSFGTGWFSWKTGFYNVIQEMGSIYDFWYNYPDGSMIELMESKTNRIKNDSLKNIHIEHDVFTKNDSGALVKKKLVSYVSIKNKVIVSAFVSLAIMGNDLEDSYISAFSKNNGSNNVFGVVDTKSSLKGNLGVEYGISKKNTIGFFLGYDKASVTWADTVNISSNGFLPTDNWTHTQFSLRWSYHIVSLTPFRLYMGAQIGYDTYRFKSAVSNPSYYYGKIEPLPISVQLNLGLSYFIKGHFGINAGVAGGIGNNDFVNIGFVYKI